MKTCLRNCKIGDTIVWSTSHTEYRVTRPFNGEFVTARDDAGNDGRFHESYYKYPGCYMKIIKKK